MSYISFKLKKKWLDKRHCTFNITIYCFAGPLKVLTDCQINMTDWVAMIDEMTALILQHHTPFRMVITKLSVESFHQRETPHLRWLLSMIDPKVSSGAGVTKQTTFCR